jgi:type I restriction enzyme S subunit
LGGPHDWAIYPDLVIRVRVDESRILPEFLEIVLQGTHARRYLTSRAKGLSSSMPKIDQPTISSLPVPIPSIDEQRILIEQWRGLRESLANLSDYMDVAVRRSAVLRRAVLGAAFSGQLGGHGSDSDRIEEPVDASHYTR